jgi:hypothetical protein
VNRTQTNVLNRSLALRLAVLVSLLILATPRYVNADTATGNDLPEDPPRTIAVVTTVETRSSRLLAERLAAAGNPVIADLQVDDLIEILNLVSLAEQESAHVHASQARSLVVPGWGQYINGDRGPALLYFAADVTIQAAAITLACLVLPPSVQWRNLNYLQTPFETIKDRWSALTASELIPSLSISAAGSILSLALRYFAAEDAGQRAVSAIDDERIVFEPRPIIRTLPW